MLRNFLLRPCRFCGGYGDLLFRESPNGWTYTISTEIGADAQGRIIEGVGVFPDVPVQTTAADSANGIDRILEKGIDIIKNSPQPISLDHNICLKK